MRFWKRWLRSCFPVRQSSKKHKKQHIHVHTTTAAPAVLYAPTRRPHIPLCNPPPTPKHAAANNTEPKCEEIMCSSDRVRVINWLQCTDYAPPTQPAQPQPAQPQPATTKPSVHILRPAPPVWAYSNARPVSRGTRLVADDEASLTDSTDASDDDGALSTTSRMTSHLGRRNRRSQSIPSTAITMPPLLPTPKHARAHAAALRQQRTSNFVQSNGYFTSSTSSLPVSSPSSLPVSSPSSLPSMHSPSGDGKVGMPGGDTMTSPGVVVPHAVQSNVAPPAHHHHHHHLREEASNKLTRLYSTASILWNEEEWTGGCALYRDHSGSTGRYSVNTQDELSKQHVIGVHHHQSAPVHRLSADLSTSSSSSGSSSGVDAPPSDTSPPRGIKAPQMQVRLAELEAECTRLRALLQPEHP